MAFHEFKSHNNLDLCNTCSIKNRLESLVRALKTDKLIADSFNEFRRTVWH